VFINGGQIKIRYVEGEGNTVTYVGNERGPGHSELSARNADGDGRATLHRFEGSKVLEEYWCEGNVRGMWRISMIS